MICPLTDRMISRVGCIRIALFTVTVTLPRTILISCSQLASCCIKLGRRHTLAQISTVNFPIRKTITCFISGAFIDFHQSTVSRDTMTETTDIQFLKDQGNINIIYRSRMMGMKQYIDLMLFWVNIRRSTRPSVQKMAR